MRAHYRAPVQDLAGDLLPGTVVSVCVNGSNGGTLLSAPIFVDDGVTNNTWSNPFTSPDGNISIFLTSPTRVDLLILPPGGQSVLFTDIDVNIPQTGVGSFTFPGSGTSSTQLGNNTVASGNQSVAYGDTAAATGNESTAAGQQAQAANTAATAFGQLAVASGVNATAVGQSAQASGTSGTALGQNSGATATTATALGVGATASATHSTALGAGSVAAAANTVVLGTSADDVIMAGGWQASQTTAQTLVNGSTITYTATLSVPVTAAANVTGLILAAGAAPGQILIINNESAFTLAFAISATSNVADPGDIITPLTAKIFVWDNNTSLWYPAVGGAPQPQLVAATPVAGYALVNGTGNVISWTAPNDGRMHRFALYSSMYVTSTETGGAITVAYTLPGGQSTNHTLYSANATGPGDQLVAQALTLLAVEANTSVTIAQASALTAGAATLWAEIWAS